MSQNISIKEKDLARNFSPSKAKTALQTSGKTLWVPKDERKRKTKSINKPGVYQAWVDECYAYSKVTVSGMKREDEIETIEKTITANGTYKAESDHVYGYDTLIVKVPGGGDDVPPSDEPGSSVYGKDPDGNDTIVSIDDDGNLVKSGLPEYIQIITPPSKLSYHDGEHINLTGIVCKAFMKNGTVWNGMPDKYPGGVLPYIPGTQAHLLIPMPPKVQYQGGGGGSFIDPYCDPKDAYYSFGGNAVEIDKNTYGYAEVRGDSEIYGVNVPVATLEKSVHIRLISLSQFTGHMRGYDHRTVQITSAQSSATVDGVAYPYNLVTIGSVTPSAYRNLSFYPPRTEHYNTDNFGQLIKDLLYGGSSEPETQTITLNWAREPDRKNLTTTFDIEVSP